MKEPKTTKFPNLDDQETTLLLRVDEITRALVDIRGQSRECKILMSELELITRQLEAISQLRLLRQPTAQQVA